MKKRVNEEEIVQMYRNGMSQRDIANALDISQPTVGYWLRKAGICNGKGRRDPMRGGTVAAIIPKHEYIVSKDEQKKELAVKNASNACLVVEDKTYSLKGVVGSCEVSTKEKIILATFGGQEIELDVDSLASLADELRALARNLVGCDVGCEMW